MRTFNLFLPIITCIKIQQHIKIINYMYVCKDVNVNCGCSFICTHAYVWYSRNTCI